MSDNVRGTGSTQQRSNVGNTNDGRPVVNSSTTAFNEGDRTNSRKIVADLIRQTPLPSPVQTAAIIATNIPLGLGDAVANTSAGKAVGRSFDRTMEMPWSVAKVARFTPLGMVAGTIYDRVTGAGK